MTLDLLSNTGTLDRQSALRPSCLLILGRLAPRRQQSLHIILDSQLDQLRLSPQPDGRADPLAIAEVLAREERVGMFRVGVEERFGRGEGFWVGLFEALCVSVGRVWRWKGFLGRSFGFSDRRAYGRGVDLRRIAGEEIA